MPSHPSQCKEAREDNFMQWDEDFDVVCVGSGLGGMSAALTAAERGATAIVLEKFNELHKSTSKHRYASLNTVFGLVLFFFVISSFWMFNFKSKAFRRGMIYAGVGFILALIMVFFQ